MKLSREQEEMLVGGQGRSIQKAMEILIALGRIYQADRLIPITSVQIAGVSYDNLGEAGLSWLNEMAEGGGRARVLATLNPAGMDIERWAELGIPPDFAARQRQVIDAFSRMGIVAACTCTPYLVGNLPLFGEHIAWAESSAVCFANSVLAARTNREGGPSALAAALTGLTPEYGLHLERNRKPEVTFLVEPVISGTMMFGALGKIVGEKIEQLPGKPIPLIRGIQSASLEELKSFCASIATYGGIGLFHMEGITPEAEKMDVPEKRERIQLPDFEKAIQSMNDVNDEEVDFVSLGCPHLTLKELSQLATLLKGRKVKKTLWITTARPVKQMADQMGYTRDIEESGAIIAADTCCVVAPIRGRFNKMATDSAKACYYAFSKNRLKTRIISFEEVAGEALR